MYAFRYIYVCTGFVYVKHTERNLQFDLAPEGICPLTDILIYSCVLGASSGIKQL